MHFPKFLLELFLKPIKSSSPTVFFKSRNENLAHHHINLTVQQTYLESCYQVSDKGEALKLSLLMLYSQTFHQQPAAHPPSSYNHLRNRNTPETGPEEVEIWPSVTEDKKGTTKHPEVQQRSKLFGNRKEQENYFRVRIYPKVAQVEIFLQEWPERKDTRFWPSLVWS